MDTGFDEVFDIRDNTISIIEPEDEDVDRETRVALHI